MANSITPKGLMKPAFGDLLWNDEMYKNADIIDLITAQLSSNSRLVSGGALTFVTLFTVNVAAGSADIGGTIYSWASADKVATAGVSAEDFVRSYLYIDNAGVVQISNVAPSGTFFLIGIADASDAAVIRTIDLRFQLGSASSLTKTSSDLDSTLGRAIAVGNFGIGVAGQDDTPILTDFDVDCPTGFYTAFGDTSPTATPGAPVGSGNVALNVITTKGQNGKVVFLAYTITTTPGSQKAWYGTRNTETGALTWQKMLLENDITSSSTDSTEGRLLKVGDFGIGIIPVYSSVDWNTLPESVGVGNHFPFVLADATSTNGPVFLSGQGYYYVQHIFSQFVSGTRNCTQIAYPYLDVNHGIFFRIRYNGVWTSWRRLLDTNDLTTSTTDSTSGRILKVSDHGIGGSTVPIKTQSGLTSTGFYGNGSNVDYTPSGYSSGGIIEGKVGTYNGFKLFFRGTSSGQMWVETFGTTSGDTSGWQLVYNQKTIVGSVSQLGGVPKGAIIERGANANGTYIKFADGTMICQFAASAPITTSGAYGSTGFFITPVQNLTFPATFITVPTVNVDGFSWTVASGWGWVAGVTTSILQGVLASAGSTATGYIMYTAVGRWF